MMLFGRKKKIDKRNNRLPLRVSLAYLMIVTIVFTGISFSKFATSGQYEVEGESKIATFKVSTVKQTSDDLVIDMTKATTVTSVSYAFDVAVDSGVRTQEKVVLTLPATLPTGVTMAMKVDGSAITPTKSGNTYTYTKTLSPGTMTNSWTLTFSADPNNENNVTEDTTLSGIKLRVDVTQIK